MCVCVYLYLLLGVISVVVSVGLSILIRLELLGLGTMLGDDRNAIVTARALVIHDIFL